MPASGMVLSFSMHRRSLPGGVLPAARSGRLLWRRAFLLAVAAIAGCLLAADAVAQPGAGARVFLLPRNMVVLTMSCPSVDLCVAEGGGISKGQFYSTLYSTDPGVGASWKFLPSPRGGVFATNQVTCPSTDGCFDVAGVKHGPAAGVFAIKNFDEPHPRWQFVGGGSPSASATTTSLSCPTAAFCAELAPGQSATGLNAAGVFWVSAQPKIPGSWHKRAYPKDAKYVFCASAQLCLADVVNTKGAGRMMSIHDPLNAASRWNDYALALPGHKQQVAQGSCSPSGTCIMLVNTFGPGRGTVTGSILTTSNIARGASSWNTAFTSHRLLFNPFNHGGCFTNGSCYATAGIGHGLDDELAVSAHPESGRASWRWIPAAATTACATPITCFRPVLMQTHSGTHGRAGIETINLTR